MSSPQPDSNAVRAVLFVDVDGTLVPETSSAIFLAARLGHADQVAEAEAAWDAGLVTARHVEELDARGWAGATEAQVSEWLAELPLVHGIGEVVGWCRDHDVVPALATLAWRPVGTYLCEAFGFDDCCGPALEVRDGVFTGVALGSCDEYGKRDFAKGLAEQHGLSLDRCAAIGDSRSDLPLFDEVGLAIAFNAERNARALAHVQIDSSDLSDAIPTLERWLLAVDRTRAKTSASAGSSSPAERTP
jgi:phosphoserine phosphatase